MLHAGRVTLRAFTPADYERQRAFTNDLDFQLRGGGSPPAPSTPGAFVESFEAILNAPEQMTFAIDVDENFVGMTGLFHLDRVNGTGELGIGIGDPAYRSHGHGREAIALMLDYAFRVQNLRRIWLGVYAPNEAARRCYRAAGFVEEGHLREHVWNDGRYVDEVIMGVLRSARTGPIGG